MKSILISIKPKYVSMILNKTKTIEVRKRFPKDYRGWVYIYCTKGKLGLYDNRKRITAAPDIFFLDELGYEKPPILNGKVVARFYCDNVEDIYNYGDLLFGTNSLKSEELLNKSCLTKEELNNYLNGKTGYAIHISQLEIFDKPKELNEFYKVGAKEQFEHERGVFGEEQAQLYVDKWFRITKAPKNYMYISDYEDYKKFVLKSRERKDKSYGTGE